MGILSERDFIGVLLPEPPSVEVSIASASVEILMVVDVDKSWEKIKCKFMCIIHNHMYHSRV